MLAPVEPTTYACKCGQYVLIVAGPSWMAWDLMTIQAEKHSKTCPMDLTA
jgi:hypothetical protein